MDRSTLTRSRQGRFVALLWVAVLMLSACGLNSRGPWVDEFGRRLQGGEMIEFDGFVACGQERVIFIRFFSDQYANDPRGQLGELRSQSGEALTFSVLPALPEGLLATGFTHAGREVFVGDDRADYLYILLPNGEVERWPRAEVACERE
jgi:hypothetical protein